MPGVRAVALPLLPQTALRSLHGAGEPLERTVGLLGADTESHGKSASFPTDLLAVLSGQLGQNLLLQSYHRDSQLGVAGRVDIRTDFALLLISPHVARQSGGEAGGLNLRVERAGQGSHCSIGGSQRSRWRGSGFCCFPLLGGDPQLLLQSRGKNGGEC